MCDSKEKNKKLSKQWKAIFVNFSSNGIVSIEEEVN